MKRFNLVLIAIVALALAFTTSCIDYEFDTPPIGDIPTGDVYTVQELMDSVGSGGNVTFDSVGSIYAIVTMDEKSGNIYQDIYAQDAQDSVCVRLNFETSTSLIEGDSIRVALQGARAHFDNGLFEIAGLHADSSIVKLGTNKNIEPVNVTLKELNSDKPYYKSRLIELEGVQVQDSDTGGVWAEPYQYGEVYLKDTLGNSVLVRTSGYARFAQQEVPKGFGSVVAIASFYGSGFQLIIRSLDEVKLDEPRWEGDGTTDPPGGSGSFDDPLNVSAAISNNTGNEKWVEGYLVGVMETNVDPFEASFETPFDTESNVIIADSPDETNLSNCLMVQLLAGDIRTAVNLSTNDNNLGEQIKLRGNLTSYFSAPGLKETDGYWLNGEGINPEDEEPINAFFEEYFTADLGDFSQFSITGAQNWYWDVYDDGCAVMSGFDGTQNANEDWLVSPEIDLTTKTNVTLNFREGINYISSYDDLVVMVSTDYDGTSEPTASGTWDALTLNSRPAGDSWTFVDSGDIDLSQYDGETIHIAFKYISSNTEAATWQIGEVLLFEAER